MKPIEIQIAQDTNKQEKQRLENELLGRFLRWSYDQLYTSVENPECFRSQRDAMVNSLADEAKYLGLDDNYIHAACHSLQFSIPQTTASVYYEVKV